MNKFLISVTLAATVAGAGAANAQAATRDSVPVAAASAVSNDSSKAGPRVAPSGVTRNFSNSGMAAFRGQPQSMGKPMAMMIVGGAAFVLGALIGSEIGTLFMLGGAISFLIGLYEYIR